MTAISNLKFDTKDVIKLFVLVSGGMTMYFNLVNEIKENKIVNNADKVIINFRLDNLEKTLCVNDLPNSVATLPQRPTIKEEE